MTSLVLEDAWNFDVRRSIFCRYGLGEGLTKTYHLVGDLRKLYDKWQGRVSYAIIAPVDCFIDSRWNFRSQAHPVFTASFARQTSPVLFCQQTIRRVEKQKADFNEEMNKFMRNLTSAVESIPGGLELRHLASTHIESLELSNGQNAPQNPKAIAPLEELVEECWSQIKVFIESREKCSRRQESSVKVSAPTGQFEGAKGEFEHWRARTQHLSSIIEQLKRKDCRYVVGIFPTSPTKRSVAWTNENWSGQRMESSSHSTRCKYLGNSTSSAGGSSN